MNVLRSLVLPGLLALCVVLSPEAVTAKPTPADTLAKVKVLLAEKDSYAAAEYVQGLGEPPLVAQAYAQLVMDLHWKASDVPGVVAMGRAGILYSLTRVRDLAAKTPEKVPAWRGHAKMIAYNLASFTWPGWGNEKLTITEADLAAGREAAAFNLRLAIELGVPPQKLSAAHWLVGAHRLSADDHAGAKASFRTAVEFSRKAGDEEGALMGEGYLAMAGVLSGDAKARKAMDAAVAGLRKIGTDDGKRFPDNKGTGEFYFSRSSDDDFVCEGCSWLLVFGSHVNGCK